MFNIASFPHLSYNSAMTLARIVAQKLIKNSKTLTLAESCTGGLVAHQLTNIPGSSKFLKLGIVAYANEAKMKLLKVPEKTIHRYGAVSRPVALLMAKGARRLMKTDFSVAITGIAGPGGATPQKSVGLTFIAIGYGHKQICKQFTFKGNRRQIKKQASEKALEILLSQVS